MSSELRAILLAALVAAPASAQEDTPPPAYDGIIDQAVSEFSAGRIPEARALFTRAHELFPNARTLRGLGMADYELRDYPAAVRELARSLTETRRALTETQRTQVNELLERARAFVGEYIVPSAPPGCRLYVDGAHVNLEGDWPSGTGQLLLGIGEHQIAIRDERGRTASARIVVRAQAEQLLDIDLSPLRDPLAEPPAEPPAHVLPAMPSHALPAPAHDSTAAWVVMISGLVVAATGGILLGVGLGDLGTVQGAIRGTEWSALAGAYDRAPILTGIGGIALSAGLVAALIGLVWGLVDSGGGGGPRHEPLVRLRGAGLEVSW